MEQQATFIKNAYPNGPPVLTYRSGMWAGSMYERQWEALQDQSLFIENENHCQGFIHILAMWMNLASRLISSIVDGILGKCAAREEYTSLIEFAALENTDGVFFDNAQSVPCDESYNYSDMTPAARASFMDSQLEMYAASFSALVNNNKYPILSTSNGFSAIGAQVPWENDCPDSEEAILQALDGIPFARNNEFWMWNLGEIASKQIRNSNSGDSEWDSDHCTHALFSF